MSEWPLIAFTLAIQLAGGLALTATLFDRMSTQPEAAGIRPIGIAIFPVAGFGLLVSLFHLGRPLSAWKSLLNLGSSRLSLEVLLTVLFVAAAFLYSQAWWTQRAEHRFAIGVVTSFLAVAAVGASAAIYVVPTQPAWNSAWVPISFFATSLLFGGCASAAFISVPRGRNLALAAAIAGSLLLIVAAAWMISSLSQGAPDNFTAARLQEALQLITSRYPVWLGLHVLLAGVIPIAFAVLLWFVNSPAAPPAWVKIFLLVAIASGTVIGRRLMFLLTSARF